MAIIITTITLHHKLYLIIPAVLYVILYHVNII